jgi:hypothetical protein
MRRPVALTLATTVIAMALTTTGADAAITVSDGGPGGERYVSMGTSRA